MVLACLPKVSDGADMCWPMVLMVFLIALLSLLKVVARRFGCVSYACQSQLLKYDDLAAKANVKPENGSC